MLYILTLTYRTIVRRIFQRELCYLNKNHLYYQYLSITEDGCVFYRKLRFYDNTLLSSLFFSVFVVMWQSSVLIIFYIILLMSMFMFCWYINFFRFILCTIIQYCYPIFIFLFCFSFIDVF